VSGKLKEKGKKELQNEARQVFFRHMYADCQTAGMLKEMGTKHIVAIDYEAEGNII